MSRFRQVLGDIAVIGGVIAILAFAFWAAMPSARAHHLQGSDVMERGDGAVIVTEPYVGISLCGVGLAIIDRAGAVWVGQPMQRFAASMHGAPIMKIEIAALYPQLFGGCLSSDSMKTRPEPGGGVRF